MLNSRTKAPEKMSMSGCASKRNLDTSLLDAWTTARRFQIRNRRKTVWERIFDFLRRLWGKK